MMQRTDTAARRPSGILWAAVRRAFPPPPAAGEALYFWQGEWRREPPPVFAQQGQCPRLLVVIPTLIRDGAEPVARIPQGLGQTLRHLRRSTGPIDVAVCVVAQDPDWETRRFGAIEQLVKEWPRLVGEENIAIVGIAASPASKIHAVNATLALQDANSIAAIAWFDDDIVLDAGVLAALWSAFRPSFKGVLGARKIHVGDRSGFSRSWARWKNDREGVNLYPHGCAMLMSRSVFASGIPPEAISDDHYYLLRLLRPGHPDPLHLLRVVPDAVVLVPAVNASAAVLRRTFRNYRNVQRVMADAPAPVIRCFLWDVHFRGLCIPRMLQSPASRGHLRTLLVDTGKFCFFSGILLVSAARGFAGRPWRKLWYSAPAPMQWPHLTNSAGVVSRSSDTAERLGAR